MSNMFQQCHGVLNVRAGFGSQVPPTPPIVLVQRQEALKQLCGLFVHPPVKEEIQCLLVYFGSPAHLPRLASVNIDIKKMSFAH